MQASYSSARERTRTRLHRLSGFRVRPHLALDPASEQVLGQVQIVVSLQPEPELRRIPEELPQPQRGVRGDPPLLEYDLVDAPGGHTDIDRDTVLAKPHWEEELLAQHFSGMQADYDLDLAEDLLRARIEREVRPYAKGKDGKLLALEGNVEIVNTVDDLVKLRRKDVPGR